MITIFCGDNTVVSRDAYLKAKKNAAVGGGFVREVEPSQILEAMESGGSDAWDLFAGRPIYGVQNFVKTVKRSWGRSTKQKLRDLAANPGIEVLDWENASAYDLGFDKEKFSFVNDFKMPVSTFTLLPLLKPGKKKEFLEALSKLSDVQPIEMTYSMIMRHVRLMVELAAGKNPRDNPFLVRMASGSIRSWTDPKKLLELYKRLLKVDVNVKTGRGTPLSLTEQLQTVSVFLL